MKIKGGLRLSHPKNSYHDKFCRQEKTKKNNRLLNIVLICYCVMATFWIFFPTKTKEDDTKVIETSKERLKTKSNIAKINKEIAESNRTNYGSEFKLNKLLKQTTRDSK